MSLELTTGWSALLEFIRTRCTATEFDNWIAPIRLLSESPEEVHLEVPNLFVQEYLSENFGDLLREFLPPNTLRFTIAEAKAVRAPQPTTPDPEPSPSLLLLNQNYTFDTFIEGPSNQFVKSAALGVATRPGKSYNPLFIHGGVGLGKTHLLHGIGHYVREHHKKLKMHPITTEAFINDVVDSLKSKSIDKMKKFYRNLDVLLVDDIQFLQNRLNFEEEVCNTFEALLNQGKQIVITSDKPPSQLKLSERLVARMEWGLVAAVTIPDLETRVAILQQKAHSRAFELPTQIAFFLAEQIASNVRQIEGAINRLAAHTRMARAPLTEETVQTILAEMLTFRPRSQPTVDAILQAVSTLFNVRVADLKGDSRQKEIALARQVAMFLAKEMLEEPLTKIAASFGGKTHSTLLHACKKIAEELQTNETLARQISMARRNIGS